MDETVDTDALLELAAIVLDGQKLGAVLDRVAYIARQTLPGAAEVSLTLLSGDEPFLAACTGPLAYQAARTQYEREQGPSIDSARAGVVLRIDDIRTETRWPQFTVRAAAQGVRSSLSAPLPLHNQYIGALTGYSRRPFAFPARHIPAAETIAGYAAVAVHNARRLVEASTSARQMSEAMASRAAIEQAKGMLMERQHCGPDKAFALLAASSQRTNTKLRDIAAQMVRDVSGGEVR
jgi:GAF domain-containing protein